MSQPHWVCPCSRRVCFPSVCYSVQALGCSAGNCLRWGLVCMHFPVLNHSGSGSQILHKVQTWLGLRFVPFPGPSSSGDQVLAKCSRCNLSPPLSLPLGFLGVQWVHLLRCAVCLSWGADLWLRPSRWMSPVQNPKKSWLAMKPTCSLVDDASLGP